MKDKVKKKDKEKKSSSNKSIMIALAISLIIMLLAVYIFTDDSTQDPYVPDDNIIDDNIDNNDDDDDNEPVITHGMGSDADDFWSRNPSDHTLPGNYVPHPSWASTDVAFKPVLIFTHSEGCNPCIEQTAICESVYASYSDEIEYYDIISGTDEPEASEAFAAYDPDGEPHYVPMTTVLTRGPDNTIIWHSWEGVVSEPVLSEWIDDALSYHEKY